MGEVGVQGSGPTILGIVTGSLRGLAERPLRFEVIEGMELGHALVDEGLGFRLLGRDREADLAHAGQEMGGVSRPVVERLAVHRMAGRGDGPDLDLSAARVIRGRRACESSLDVWRRAPVSGPLIHP